MKKFQKIYENVLNENPNTRFKKAVIGVLPDVKTFVIVTPENPMGKLLVKKENIERIETFKTYLKNGRYKYIRIKGKYGNTELPFVIFNVSISESKTMADKYKQESFIYARNKNAKQEVKNVMFEYWKRPDEKKAYKKIEQIDKIRSEDDAEDFYSRLKSWKFNIPFKIFESILSRNLFEGHTLSKEVVENINALTDKMLQENITGKYSYNLRGYINACVNTGKVFDAIDE